MQDTKKAEDWNYKKKIKNKIKNVGGDWPMTSEKLVNNYLKMFVQFVSSIDFTDL